MNFKQNLALIGLALLAASCDGDVTKASGDTSTLSGCATPFEGPIVIVQAGIVCDNASQVTFTASTDGLTSGGLIYSQETGNVEPQYSDEHDLESTDWDEECGSFDNLARTLSTDAAFGASVVNQSTVFSCAADTHFASDVMSYVVRVYDFDDSMADCLAAGDDAQGVLDSTYEAVNPPFSPSEFANCDVGAFSY